MAPHIKRFTEGKLDTRKIMRKLSIRPGLSIVDAGCGNGYMSMLFHREVTPGGTVYALDMNEHFISEIQAEITDENIRPVVGDIVRGTTLPDGCADVVFIATVLHIFSMKQLSLVAKEVRRLLVSGGLLGVVEFAKHPTTFGPPMSHRFSAEELQMALPFTSLGVSWVAEHFYLQIFRVE